MNMFGKIRRLRFRDGLSINEISRRTAALRDWMHERRGCEW